MQSLKNADWVWSKHEMEEEQQQRIELEVHVSCGGMGVTTKDWTQSRHATKEHEWWQRIEFKASKQAMKDQEQQQRTKHELNKQ